MNLRGTLPALLVFSLAVLAAPVLRADTLSASLANDTLTTTAGSTVTFQVNLSNGSSSDTFLNSDEFITSSPLISVDDSPYFSFAFPGVISAGGFAGPLDLFNIIVDPTAVPGSYTGTFTMLGGAGLGSLNDLADLNFTVDVTSPTNVPEPGTLATLLFGAALAGALSLLKLRSA